MSLLASLSPEIWPASKGGPGLQRRFVSALLHLELVEEVRNRHSEPQNQQFSSSIDQRVRDRFGLPIAARRCD